MNGGKKLALGLSAVCAVFGILFVSTDASAFESQARTYFNGITLVGKQSNITRRGPKAVRIKDKLRVDGKLIAKKNIQMQPGKKVDGVDISAFKEEVDSLLMLPTDCEENQVAAFDGDSWICADDAVGEGDGDTIYTAGTGISISAGVISSTITDTDTTYTAGTGIEIDGTSISSTVTDTDTTYAAGDGLTLGEDTFSVDLGTSVDDSEVDDDITIEGGSINETPIGATTASTGNFTNVTYNGEARQAHTLPTVPMAHVETVIDDSSAYIGQGASVTIGTNGFPVMSYVDVTNRMLKVAACLNEACSSSTVTSVNAATLTSSIAIGANGFPMLVFDEWTGSDTGGLHFIACGNADCSSDNTTTELDATGWAEQVAVITGSDGLPFVAYEHTDDRDLKVVHCGNATCSSGNTSTIVDNGDADRSQVGLALGADGYPIITYTSRSATDLKFVKCESVTCDSSSASTIDSSGSVGQHSSVALGIDGLPIISYYDASNTSLKVAHCGNAACSSGNTLTTVDNDGSVGEYGAITIGADGYPAIVYIDDDTEVTPYAKYAKCTSIDCSTSFTNIISDVGNGGIVQKVDMIIGRNGLPFIAYIESGEVEFKTTMLANTYGVNYLTR